jgi:hypothetical protein
MYSCSLLQMFQRNLSIQPSGQEDGGDTFLWNTDIQLKDNKELEERRRSQITSIDILLQFGEFLALHKKTIIEKKWVLRYYLLTMDHSEVEFCYVGSFLKYVQNFE